MKLGTVKDVTALVLMGVAAYVVYQTFKKGSNAAKDAVQAVATGLLDTFMKDPTEQYYLTVTFLNGERHAIAAGAVSTTGRFVNSGNGINYKGDGLTYQIYDNQQGQHFAVPVQ